MKNDRGERAMRRADELRARLDRPRRVLLRDFLIFELKLLLDGVKGILISQAALAAMLVDFLRPGGKDRKLFYRVLNVGERMDVWLSLYSASRNAAEDPEGLLGESREGSPNLLGQIEHLVHRVVVGDHPGEGAGSELYTGGSQPRGGSPGATPPPREPYTGERSGFEEMRVKPEAPR